MKGILEKFQPLKSGGITVTVTCEDDAMGELVTMFRKEVDVLPAGAAKAGVPDKNALLMRVETLFSRMEDLLDAVLDDGELPEPEITHLPPVFTPLFPGLVPPLSDETPPSPATMIDLGQGDIASADPFPSPEIPTELPSGDNGVEYGEGGE